MRGGLFVRVFLSFSLLVCLIVCLFVCLFDCLFVCLSVCLIVWLFVCLFVWLFACLFADRQLFDLFLRCVPSLCCSLDPYRRFLVCFVSRVCITARLAQSAERKALNLVVVGSSPTVGVTLGR